MKATKFACVIIALLAVVMVGCKKQDALSHTDASTIFDTEAVFEGLAYLPGDVNDTISRNVKIVIKSVHESAGKPVQAVNMNFTCHAKVKNTKGKYVDVDMDETAMFNIAKAGDQYYFTNGMSPNPDATGATYCGGKLNGDELVMTLCTTAQLKLSTASTCKYYTFVAKRH